MVERPVACACPSHQFTRREHAVLPCLTPLLTPTPVKLGHIQTLWPLKMGDF
jgi:hypothetical protein